MSATFILAPGIGALPIRLDASPAQVSLDVGAAPDETYERDGRMCCEVYGTAWVYYDNAGCSSIVLRPGSPAFFEGEDLFALPYGKACERLEGADADIRRSRFGECTSLRLGIRLLEGSLGSDALESIVVFRRGFPFCEEALREVARRWIHDEEALREIEQFLWAGEEELAFETLAYVMREDGVLDKPEAARDLARIEGMVSEGEEERTCRGQQDAEPEGIGDETAIDADDELVIPIQPEVMLEGTTDEFAYYLAYIQGEQHKGMEPTAGEARLMSGLLSRIGFSCSTLFLGPVFWAYRKCYLGAALLIGVCLSTFLFGYSLDTRELRALPLLIAAFVFYRLYRYQAQRALRSAWAQGIEDPADVEEWMRRKGGTSIVGALLAGLVYVAIAIAFAAPLVGIRMDALNMVF